MTDHTRTTPDRTGRERDPRLRVPDRIFDAYIFDLDGTVYLGDELLPGAQSTIAALRRAGRPVRFLSNNPTRTSSQYAEKLRRLGVPTEPDEAINTIVTMIGWLHREAPGATVFALAEPPLLRALESAGVPISDDPAKIDVVIASFDRTFSYRKLQIAFDALWYHRRARLVATNPDHYCPLPRGRGEPDCAAVIAAIQACTGMRCETIVGKPNPIMLTAALTGLDVNAEDCLMVGDRLSTDIRLGHNAGAATALVLTGDSRLSDLDDLSEAEHPTFVVPTIGDLLPEPAAAAPAPYSSSER